MKNLQTKLLYLIIYPISKAVQAHTEDEYINYKLIENRNRIHTQTPEHMSC